MNPSKKQRLAQLLPLLDELQGQLKEARNSLMKTQNVKKFNSVIYAPVTAVLYSNTKKGNDDLFAWQNKVKATKMVRAAKNLSIMCNDDIISMFAELSEQNVSALKAINPGSTLTPKVRRIEHAIRDPWANARLFAEGLYSNYFGDMFMQGRLHQAVYNPKTPLAKFASQTVQDNDAAYAIQKRLHSAFNKEFDHIRLNFISHVSNLVANRIGRDDLTDMMDLAIVTAGRQMVNLVRSHLSETYAAGNLYQLGKDGTDWVFWQTGQHADDCGHCRAIQMGDILLDGVNYQRLDFDRVAYSLSDILAITNEKGARYFNHDGCRCTFVSR